jgi:hypothetical protein
MRQQRCHISLSLSLCHESSSGQNARFGARNGARDHLLESCRRASERGVRRSKSAKQGRDFIPAGLLSAGRNVRILRCSVCARSSIGGEHR